MVIFMVYISDLKEQVNIPDGATATIKDEVLTVKGEKGEVFRLFSHPKINLKVNGNIVEIHGKDIRRREKALVGTYKAHIKNMIRGVTKGYEYKMKTVFSHFPIKTSVEGNEFIIQNFLGERSPRRARILEGVNVEVKSDEITIKGIDKEKVGQTVANIERATKVKNRDIRIFQDGVYLTTRGDR